MAVMEGLLHTPKRHTSKDIAVRPYEDGFQMSEVPLGTGILDLTANRIGTTKGESEAALLARDDERDPLKFRV